MRPTSLLIAIAACVLAARADAQRVDDVPAGARVRLAIADSLRQEPFLPRGHRVIGTLARATPDTLWLHVVGPDTVRVPRSAVRGVEVSRGASGVSSALEQFVAVALIFGIPLYSAADDRDERQRAIVIVGGTAVVAAVVGALRPNERWRRVR